MDWTEVAIYGLLAAAAAAIAAGVEKSLRKPAEPPNKVIRIILMVVFLFALNGLYALQFRPLVVANHAKTTLLSIPLYAAIEIKDPDLFNKLLTRVSSLGLTGANADQIADAVSDIVSGPEQQYLASAPDDIINRFADVTIRTLNIRRQQTPVACYLTLYPQLATSAERPLISYKNLPLDVHNEMMAVITAAVASFPVTIFLDTAVPERLLADKVAPFLAKSFGADVQSLTHPEAPSANRATVCDVTIAMMTQVRTLEPSESAIILRYMFSQK